MLHLIFREGGMRLHDEECAKQRYITYAQYAKSPL